MAVTQLELQQLYVAHFGRPADPAGVAYYTSVPNVTIWDVAGAFSASPESKALYGNSVSSAMVNSIYQNLFNRDAEPAGINYWVGKVFDGQLTPGGVALAILLGAQNDDRICIQNKLAIANEFTDALLTLEPVYSGDSAAAVARAFLHTVAEDAATVTAAHNGLAAAIAAAANPGGNAVPNPTGNVDPAAPGDGGTSPGAPPPGGTGSDGAGDTPPGGQGTDTPNGGTGGNSPSGVVPGGTGGGELPTGPSGSATPVVVQPDPVRPNDDDTVFVGDADTMGQNSLEDGNVGTAPTDIAFLTFLDFDTLKNPGTDNTRKAFSDQTPAEIEDVRNQNQFKFNLSRPGGGPDTDTVDYSNAMDDIAVVVELDAAQPYQHVLVDSEGGASCGTGSFDDAKDRVDLLNSVERIVASQAISILDLTSAGKGTEIRFHPLDLANRVAAQDRDVFSVQISDLASAVPLTRSFLEYRDAGQSATVVQATATWNRIEGGDFAERVIMSSAHSDNTDVMNLRGGANEVKYNELTRSITTTLGVIDWDAANPLTSGKITATVQFQDGTGANVEGPYLPSGTIDTITSYTANNGIAAGSLRIAASQDAEDTLKFAGLTEKLFLLSEVGTTDNQITVKLGSGSAENSIVLTGFELVADAASNDVYDFGSLLNAAAGLQFIDNVADHDTIKVGNDAIDVDGTNAMGGGAQLAGATEISLAALRDLGTLATVGFDFDVLDVTKVTNTTVTTLTGASAVGEFNTDEVVIGKINNINSALNFEAVVFTQDTVAENGTTYVLDTTANNVKAGAKTIALTNLANTLSFGGTVLEQGAALRAATGLNATSGVTVTVVGNEAVNITGGNGNDTITASGGADTLRGNQGNDTLDGNFVAEQREVHTYTLSNPAGGAGETVILDGFTVTEGALIRGVIVAGNDADAIGAAFVREWSANPVAFTNNASIQSVTYDALTNALTFTFTSAVGNVADALLGAAGGTAAASVSAETVQTAYAARTESSDTFVFEGTAALNGVDTLNNVDATDKLNFDAFGTGLVGFGGDWVATVAAAGTTLIPGFDFTAWTNKASLSVADFASGVGTAGKMGINDGDHCVVAVSADVDGAADATQESWNLYYVVNGATAGAGDLTVTLVGTLNTAAAELTAAQLAAMVL